MNPPPAKKTIVWDLDDVLNPLMEVWLELGWKAEHPDCAVRFEELVENPPTRILGCTTSEYLDSLDRFRLSKAAGKMAPNRQIFDWFESDGAGFEHHVLTARPAKTVAPAAEWVFTHFGRWIRHFHFVPSRRDSEDLPLYDQTKGEMLAKLGPVHFFVDDSPENVAQAGRLGIPALIFPQPWNTAELAVSGILDELTRNSLS